jgi:hypothetical protein
MTVRVIPAAALAGLLALTGCAEPANQRAAADGVSCPPLTLPPLTNPGSITRMHDPGMLTQLRRKC